MPTSGSEATRAETRIRKLLFCEKIMTMHTDCSHFIPTWNFSNFEIISLDFTLKLNNFPYLIESPRGPLSSPATHRSTPFSPVEHLRVLLKKPRGGRLATRDRKTPALHGHARGWARGGCGSTLALGCW